jgi:hypothetical protein
MLKPEALTCQGHSSSGSFFPWGILMVLSSLTLDTRDPSPFCSQLTKLDVAAYKEYVAVKEFALNRRPAKRIAPRMGG